MKKIDLAAAPKGQGTRYPAPYNEPCKNRAWLKLGDAARLTQFGVNLLTLGPGTWSSQRHWHTHDDEFVYVLEGEVVMVTDAGDETMRPGDCAGFKGGARDGHCFQNRSGAPVKLLVIGSRSEDDAGEYSDIDMKFLSDREGGGFVKKNGERF